jgi:hypothetical protein
MKLCLGALAVLGTVLLTAATGCGPGLGHHGQFAKAPDAVSMTSLTSEEMALPTSRMPVAREFDNTGWEDPWADEQSDSKLQTWGAAPNPEDKYGF